MVCITSALSLQPKYRSICFVSLSINSGVYRMSDFITTAMILIVVALAVSRLNKGMGLG
jgi:hypothetical protein